MQATDIIDKLGGPAVIAALLGIRPTAVKNWRYQGIPAKYWIPIIETAKRKRIAGITAHTVAWRPRKASS